MLWRTFFIAAFFTGTRAYREVLFDFSDLEVVEPPSAEKAQEPDPPPLEDDGEKKLPEPIQTVLGKLDHFSSFKRTALMQEIAAARNVAAEILVKQATAADAAKRAALLTEAKRVESLPPELPLIEPGATSARAASNVPMPVGSWKRPNNKKWINTLMPDGSLVRGNGATGRWRWVDEKRGVFLFDYTPSNPNAELVQVDLKSKPLKAVVRAENYFMFPVFKATTGEAPSEKKANPSEPVIKLAAHEAGARKETETLIQSKNTKVAAWLLKQAPSLPAPQAKVVVERASELEGKLVNSDAAKSADNLAGVWSWAGKKLEFAAGGIVKVNKNNGGKWVWARSNSKSVIAFVLDVGDTVALARLSNSEDGILRVAPMKGKRSDARRE